MGKHALLSASSSKRWLSCTPSARLEEQFKDEPGGSVYAEEGTAAHALAEHKLKKALKRRSKRPVSDYHCDEMEECTDGYVAFAMEQVELAKQECSDPVVLVEQRLDYSAYVPEGFGTGDLLIVADKVLTVIDLKYGKGVAVDAEWNPQMMLYGLGALELFDALYDIDIIRMAIYQPRLESVSTWKRMAGQMEKLGILTEIDMAAFAGYCQAYARWKEAEEFITQHGTIVKTPSGYWQQVPQVSIAQTYLKIMNRFCEQFGLTPSSRSRIVAEGGEDKESDAMELLLFKGGGG